MLNQLQGISKLICLVEVVKSVFELVESLLHLRQVIQKQPAALAHASGHSFQAKPFHSFHVCEVDWHMVVVRLLFFPCSHHLIFVLLEAGGHTDTQLGNFLI